MSQKRYKVVDLFSGAGGFGRGFKDTGFKILLAIENQKSAAKTYKYNIPEAFVLAEDIKTVTGDDLKKITNDEPEVVIGSPPCEPFTAANPNRMDEPLDRLYTDPIGRLTLHFLRIISEIKPKIWVMENVPAITEDGLKQALEKEARRAGYNKIYFNILRAEDYCTPSHRIRLFLSNIEIKPVKCQQKITVEKALKDLPPPNPSYPPNHEPSSISPRKEKRIMKLKQGKAMVYYTGHKGRRLPNLIRLDPNDIAPTVLGSSRFIHPYEPRFLTVREQARLMGYPDDHVFLGGRDEQYNMIGESVPVTLSRAIAKTILEKLKEEDVKQ